MRNAILVIFAFLLSLGFSTYISYQKVEILSNFKQSIERLEENIFVRTKNGKIFIEIRGFKISGVWHKLVFSNIYIISYSLENNELSIVARPEGRKFFLLKNDESFSGSCNYIQLK